MRICKVLASTGKIKGGLERHFIDVSNALSARHEVHVTVRHRNRQDFSSSVTAYTVDFTRSRRSPGLLIHMLALINRISPEILHAHANKAAQIVSAIRPLLRNKGILVATLHSTKRQAQAYKSFDLVIGVSRRSLERLPGKNTQLIYNGLQIDVKRRRGRQCLADSFGLADEKCRILFIGQLARVKRVDVLLRAFRGVPQACLLVVGDDECSDELKALAAELGLENCLFAGHRTDNIEILSSADLVVITSEREGFPCTLAKALYLHAPVVSTDVSDVAMILPGEYVVPVNDHEQLHAVLTEVAVDYKAVARDFKDAFSWAEDHLDFDHMTRRIEDAYRKTGEVVKGRAIS
ncbi:MAG: glycosyltransferase [Gammaproteobacteria bacterium]